MSPEMSPEMSLEMSRVSREPIKLFMVTIWSSTKLAQEPRPHLLFGHQVNQASTSLQPAFNQPSKVMINCDHAVLVESWRTRFLRCEAMYVFKAE